MTPSLATRPRLAAFLALLAFIALGIAVLEAGPLASVNQPAWSAHPSRSNRGAVLFVLTPRGVSGELFRVDLQADTRSGDLSRLDLMAATELHVDGRTLRPVKAPTLHGRHAQGRLDFVLGHAPDAFDIVIRNVRTMGDLTFHWP